MKHKLRGHSDKILALSNFLKKSLFLELLGKANFYAEWGIGSSTEIASSFDKKGILSIESSPFWIDRAKRVVTRTQVDFVHANIGPTGKLGYPRRFLRPLFRNLYPSYSLALEESCEQIGWWPDLILVDGRFRSACFARAWLAAPPGTQILFDDYVDSSYSEVEAFAQSPIEIRDGVAHFVVPGNVRREDAEMFWEAEKENPA